MQKHISLVFLLMLSEIFPGAAHAARGEVIFQPLVSNEIAFLLHPGAGYASSSASKVYVPRLGGQISYGLANWLLLSVGADFALPRDVTARSVAFQGLPVGDLYAEYTDVFLPISLSTSLTHGSDFSLRIEGSAGLAVFHWQDHMLLQPGQSAQRYPIERTSTWSSSPFVRAEVAAEWRPLDWFAVVVGPYATRTTTGNTYLGMAAHLGFVVGVGSF